MKKILWQNLTIGILVSGILFSFAVNSYSSGLENLKNNLQADEIKATESSAASNASTEFGVGAGSDTGVVMASCLNVRTAPWGSIIGTVSSGKKLDIIGKDGVWYKIKYNGRDAYVHSGYVATEGAPASASDSYVNVGAGSTLNVRTGAWGSVIGSLSNGAAVEILGKSGDWSIIKYNGKQAYVYTKYLSKTKPSGSSGSSGAAKAVGSVAPSSGSSNGKMIRPVSGGPVTSPFGMRTHPVTGGRKMHNGIDIGVPTGTPLKALSSGRVQSVDWNYGGGKTITIKYDNGMTSTYMHCKDATLSAGATVSQGQVVGHTNNTGAWTTGPHLHFELRNSSGSVINPSNYISI
ncbi:MAG: peptidoglycan DD-metalloendopeptidase family protein [Candidatus Wallbacteria bacterium]